MRTRSLIPAALLLCGCSLRHKTVAPEPARGPARDSLFHFDQARSDSVAARGLVGGLLADFAVDVAYLRAGAPTVFGRERVRALLGSSPVEGSVSFEPLGGNVSSDHLAGYTYGVAGRSGASRVRVERYIAFWERTTGQPWRIVAYVEVGAPPAGASADVAGDQAVPPEPSVAKPIAEARAGVRAADSLFSDLSYRMGVGYAFSNTIAEDGVVFGSPQLLIGPRAVAEWYESRDQSTSLTWRPIFASVAGSRDLGYTIGESVTTARGPSGAAVQRPGKYLTVWRRQKDGTWRFVIDGGNASPARP